MRLKCNDGKVRNFTLPWTNNLEQEQEAQCLECGEYFGIHDTKILKPRFKEHICPNKENINEDEHGEWLNEEYKKAEQDGRIEDINLIAEQLENEEHFF